MLFGEKTLRKRRFSLHVPEDLAEWLEKEAARQDRTRNNLINWILEQYSRHAKNIAKQSE